MDLSIRSDEVGSTLAELCRIPIAFRVERVLDVVEGSGLVERPLARPYVKDYDEVEPPAGWARRFDVSTWAAFGAWDGDRRVGSALLARDGAAALLWDLRVHPGWRRRGAGSALFAAAETRARQRGDAEIRVETQNLNVPACRFYERCGCTLWKVDPHAYPGLPGEIRLIWRKPLRPWGPRIPSPLPALPFRTADGLRRTP